MKKQETGLLRCASILAAIAVGFCDAQTLNAQAVTVKPGDDVAALVRGANPGTTFLLSPGIYRLQSIVPKANDTFTGNGEVILSGAAELKMRPDAGVWSAGANIATSDPKYCRSDHPLCYLLSDLFLDDKLQTPVSSRSDLQPGTWFYDATAHTLYIGSDPTGHLVELGETPAAFSGSAPGVVIEKLVVEKYASPPQRGAIGAGGVANVPAGWSVKHVEARWNHGAGIHLGTGGHIENCNVHHNGQLGLGAGGSDVVITHNEIAFNNYAGYRDDWEAGATKFAKTTGLMLTANNVHDNAGNGLWTDIDNRQVVMDGNTISNNSGEGIRHEISYDAVIRNNILKGNKSGIVIAMSSGVDVYGNNITVPANGEFGLRLDVGTRVSDSNVPYTLQNVRVHNNVITYLGAAGRSGLVGQVPQGSYVVFDNNEYELGPAGEKGRFRWNGQALDLTGMQQAGMETHGITHH